MQISKTAWKILRAMEEYCEISPTQLARKLRMDKQRIYHHIERMKRIGVLKGGYIVLPYPSYGFTLFQFRITMGKATAKERYNIKERLKLMPQVYNIYEYVGKETFLAEVRVKEAQEVFTVMKTIEDIFSNIVEKISINIVEEDTFKKPQALIRQHVGKHMLRTEDVMNITYPLLVKEIPSTDEMDILEYMSRHPFCKKIDIARALKYPLKKISEASQWINKTCLFRLNINMNMFGWRRYHFFIKLTKKERDSGNNIEKNAFINRITYTNGTYNMMVELDTSSDKELMEFTEELNTLPNVTDYDFARVIG